MTDAEDPDIVYDQIRGILGEHFHNFCFIVMDDDGDLFYDYTNYRVGKMLMTEAIEDLNSEVDELDWEELVDEDEHED
jgi:hypothetical protein|tara:strand:+ start:241 stop:474 length:234 start_codon:yes stop_codon:yes gene_type:complete